MLAAIEEARLRGTTVRAVHVWHVPEGVYLTGFAPSEADRQAFEDKARRLLADAVAESAGDGPEVPVEQVLREASAVAPALLAEAEAETAPVLVVGSHGRAGLREFVLGSVSHECCRHAHCPVLVVPPPSRLDPDQAARSPVALAGDRQTA